MADEQQAQSGQQEFVIQKIYVKDISFEAPNTPAIFRDKWAPQIDLELNNHASQIEEGVYEAIISVNVKAKIGEKVAFMVEIQQAGIFTMTNFTAEQIRPLLGSFCPTILYPYAREVVADVVNRGGFPPLNLAPVNFEALYQQQEQQLKAKETVQ